MKTIVKETNLTVSQKSLGQRYGCKYGFLFLLPAKYEDSLKQSKNLSNFAMKYAVSKPLLPLSCIAFDTESLKTFKKHVYRACTRLHYNTNLYCQINTHLRKTRKLNVLASQFWH